MRRTALLLLLNILTTSEGWFLSPCKVKKIKTAKAIAQRSLFVGAATAGAAFLGTATVGAGAVAAAVVVNNQVNRPKPYEPKAGSMDSKVVLITGGSSGLGLESAKRLAAAGATVILTSRTNEKGQRAVEEVEKYLNEKEAMLKTGKVFSLPLDLDDLSTVMAFPKKLNELGFAQIDVLLNNAGVMALPKLEKTKDGFERQFQSNHLGHFALTAKLFPYLNREGATVVTVSSSAINFAQKPGGRGLDFDNLNAERDYQPWSAYGLSKLSNVLFTKELQRRADEAGETWLTAVTLHPGVVATDLGRYVFGEDRLNSLPVELKDFAGKATTLFLKTAEEGASTQVYLASGAEGNLQKGAFYDDLKVISLPDFATDKAAAKRLWDKSEILAGVTFDIGTFEDDNLVDAEIVEDLTDADLEAEP